MQPLTTPHSPDRHPAIRAAARLPVTVLLALLVACERHAPVAPSSQSQLAEPLETAYRQLSDPPAIAQEQSCDNARALGQALEGWIAAVDATGLHSRFAAETADARRRMATIHARCAASPAEPMPLSRNRLATPSHTRDEETRPAITVATLDAYVRGQEAEIALMRANGTHLVSLSKYGDEGRRVAAKAGLPLPAYRALRTDMHRMLHEVMMHERYAGPAGQARLVGLEPHKRAYAVEVLARDPYASLSAVERDAVQARLAPLRSQYDAYLDLAAIAD